jgi:hypothetical protein
MILQEEQWRFGFQDMYTKEEFIHVLEWGMRNGD